MRRSRRANRLRFEVLEDRLAMAVFTVGNTNNSGPGSLRQSIFDANTAPGADVIQFNIGGGGVQTIAPTSALPTITGPTTIDAWTQPGFSGSPLIELSGASAGTASGLILTGGNSVVRGLIVNRFSGAGIALAINASNNGNLLEGNYVGTNVAGTVALANGTGVFVGSAFNRIGTNGDGVGDALERNVIAGSTGNGIQVQGAGAHDNIFAGNYIGTDASGTAALGNTFGINITLSASSNRVGTDADGISDAGERNIISGNRSAAVGINVGSSQNIVAGNYLGTDVTGTFAIANQGGVAIGNASSFNRVGSNGDGVHDNVEGNVIAGNTITGASINGVGSDNNVIAGNVFGADKTGMFAIPNGGDAVFIGTGAKFNRIGTNSDGMSDVIERNLISGTANNGIRIDNAHDNVVAGNFIGTNTNGTGAIPNATGVLIHNGATGNRIGTNGNGIHDDVERNVVSGNRFNGFFISGTGTINNSVAGNYIGTTADGLTALGNGQIGVVLVNGPRFNRIGSDGNGVADDAERNVISGNGINGVVIRNAGTDDNVVSGNYIGTDATGMSALPNGTEGVTIDGGARNNRVGTNGDGVHDDSERNVISGNNRTGIAIFHVATQYNSVAGNYIGVNASGTSALGNLGQGIFISASFNRVGTNGDGVADAAEANVISGNGITGVTISGVGSDHNVVAGNFISTDKTGTAGIANGGDGVFIGNGSVANRIGTNGDGVADALERNVISGALFQGIRIDNAHQNLVAGNYIGADVTGTTPLGNASIGIVIHNGARDNQIGGTPILANTIAYNGLAGVVVRDVTTVRNTIRANSIHSNARIGIDLGEDNFTLNDTFDADAGPNDLQNFPVIISAMPGASTQVVGRFHSQPNTTYTLDFYASTVADPTGFGEGQRYLGAVTVATDAAGNATFNTVLPSASTPGEIISATATDPLGNTSEFSGNRAPTANAGGPYDINEGQSVTLDASASSDPDADQLTYSWDVNGDGAFGDATGVQPTLTWAQLEALGIDDGPHVHQVRVRVDDDAGHVVTSVATTLTVNNVDPTAGVAGPSAGVSGQPRDFTLTAADLSSADEQVGFTFSVNWGDGTPVQTVPPTPENGDGTVVAHIYAAPGSYQVTVTATDKDGGISGSATHNIVISSILIGDGCCCEGPALIIGGTLADDTIRVVPQGSLGDVKILINGQDLGTFAGSSFNSIAIFGQGGNDDLEVAGSIDKNACLNGGDGDDRLKGSAGADILLGGDGDDLLIGGSGHDLRDLLIGGTGADRLVGNSDDDILIAGTAAWDSDESALCAILEEWSRMDLGYEQRVQHLQSGGGLNGAFTLNVDPSRGPVTVFDDGAADVLTGSAGRDWFFANLDNGVLDKITDLHASEFTDDLDFIAGP